jgi:hypothetical protein
MASADLSILVVSYSDDVRAALVATLAKSRVNAVACENFRQAEELALLGLYNGLVIDLPSIVKAKGEEKIVAYTLANFFPTLRVRAIGGALIPMAMPGGARQDKSLNDFLTKTCVEFTPRALRSHRRHAICVPVLVNYRGEERRGMTLNLSWGGAFVVDMQAEHFQAGERVEICFPRYGGGVRALIRWVVLWGMESPPGIGVSFEEMDAELETVLAGILKTRRGFDRDRLTP